MVLKELNGTYAVALYQAITEIPDMAHESEFFNVTRTEREVSLVCEQQYIEGEKAIHKGLKALRISGKLDFEEVGILSELTDILAAEQISVFNISTYLTDYLFVPGTNLEKAKQALAKKGHTVTV